MTREDYLKYLESTHWKVTRYRKLQEDGEWEGKQHVRCEECRTFVYSGYIQIHHKHYRTLGKESNEDLGIACPDCHRILDATRNN